MHCVPCTNLHYFTLLLTTSYYFLLNIVNATTKSRGKSYFCTSCVFKALKSASVCFHSFYIESFNGSYTNRTLGSPCLRSIRTAISRASGPSSWAPFGNWMSWSIRAFCPCTLLALNQNGSGLVQGWSSFLKRILPDSTSGERLPTLATLSACQRNSLRDGWG